MEYYLIHKNQKDGQLLLGTDNGFGVFWADQGFSALINLVQNKTEHLEDMEIRNSSNEVISVSNFLDIVAKLKLRVNT